jgi:Putative 8-oxoguanine DNA glycosylase OGG-like protein
MPQVRRQGKPVPALRLGAEFVAVVPYQMRRVVGAWRAAGSPAQDGIAWPRQRWINQFTQFADAFTMLPDHLNRSVIRGACRRAGASAVEAEQAFLAVMAWGYGRVGYGPYRVRRLFDVTPDAGTQLQVAARTLAAQGPVAAYARLGDHGVARLAGLGPAFGTKFLYFCSPMGRPPALILDRLVAQWLRGYTDLRLNEVRWSVTTYSQYLESMYAWADELAVAADELETCIFSEQAGLAGSQWA